MGGLGSLRGCAKEGPKVGFEDARYEVAELALPDGLVMLGV
ncbi:MAG: hypothetical protein ACJAUC_002743, partial [Planctomycetota bacterium]